MRTTFLICLVLFSNIYGQSDIDKGKAWYDRRAEGASGSRAASAPIDSAISYFERSMDGGDEIEAALMLVKAFYFKGEYTTNDKEEKKTIFDRGKRFAENYIDRYPDSALFRYWYLVNLGSWSKAYGILTAAREGVADLMREHSEKIIELDPGYENGGGYFMLGAVHYESPYIPFLLSWPDNDDAVIWLRKAVETGNARLVQMVYLAKALYKDGQEGEAISMLEKVVNSEPSPHALVEQRDDIREARELLGEYR
jgi:tetratricopeptide (TPR) repeat protein